MPELPEVEVTRRKLAPRLCGRTILGVLTRPGGRFFLTTPSELRRRLPGRTVTSLERHGKYLIASLDDSSRLVLHLGMTGQLFTPDTRPSNAGTDHHTHLELSFADSGPDLFFRDVRKFGKVLWLRPGASSPRLDKLGVDTLQARGTDLFAATRKRRIPIKVALLDQRILAGVGNIYADEALFRAGVRPTRAASRVSQRACERIVAALREVMQRSIRRGGTSVSDYVDPDRTRGTFQRSLLAYGREGAPCTRCSAPLRRVVLGGRSSHFCPACQL